MSVESHDMSAPLERVAAASGRPSTLVRLAAGVIVIAGLRQAEPLLVPLVFAALVVALSSPLSAWAARRGLPAVVGALLALVADLALIVGMGFLFKLAIGELQEKLPLYVARAGVMTEGVAAALQARHIPVTQEAVDNAIGAASLLPLVGIALSQLANAASGMGVVLLVVFFALWEMSGLARRLHRLFPAPNGRLSHVDRVVREVQRYLLVKTLISALMAVLVFAWLKILGVGLCLLLSALMFALHFVPNIGAIAATLPAVVVALLDRGPAAALAVLIGYVVLLVVVGSVLESRALGRTLGVSPLVVLLGLLFWGWLWGVAGALLSVPLTMTAKIVLENTPDLAWIAHWVEPEKDPEEPITRRIHRTLTLHPRPSIGIGSARPTPPAGHARAPRPR